MALGISNKELGQTKKKYYGKFYVHDKYSRWEGEEKSGYNISQNRNISYLQSAINITLTTIYQIKYTLLNVKRKILKYFSLLFGNKIKKKNFDFNINVKDELIKNFSEELKKRIFYLLKIFFQIHHINIY